MSERRDAQLGDFVSLQRGTTYKSSLLGLPGPVLLGLASIQRNGGFRSDALKTYGGDSPNKLLLAPGDMYVSLKDVTQSADLLGAVARVPSDVSSGRVTQDTVKLIFDREEISREYVYWLLRTPQYRQYCHAHSNGTTNLSLSREDFLRYPVPPLTAERTALMSLLAFLDDKIAVNELIAATARDLGLTFYSQSLHDDDFTEVVLESVTTELTRGIAPKYTDSPDELTVLNQKCIRDGRVNLEPSRMTLREKVKAPKLLQLNDVLVNSTGVGTLGRVARWTSSLDATVDSHITIVRFNEDKVDPVCAGFAMLRAQPEIEVMGEGSTGQTELRRSQVAELELALPDHAGQKELRPKLEALEERADQALRESLVLADLRDALLSQLMSGKLRIRDAEKIVEDAI